MAACIAACGHHAHADEEGSHDHETEEAGHEGHGHADQDHGDEIILEPEKARAAGVKVETVKPANFHGVIHTSGKVMAASCDETTVVATISGRVAHMGHVSEGLKVAGGTTLFSITSAGMQVADGDPVQRAKIDFERAERDYTRAQALIKDKIISVKDFAVAKAEYEAAKLTYTSMQKTRSAGGVALGHLGTQIQMLVLDDDGQRLARFDELNNIRSAKFSTSYSNRLYDISQMGGHIQSYGRSAEVNNSYIPVIFEFNNTGDVVQGSYADIYLITHERQQVITLPLTAITEEQGLHYIYIQKDAEGYQKQEVTLGESDGERIEIKSGVKAGDRVVTRGAIQVKLASASNAIPAHNHNH